MPYISSEDVKEIRNDIKKTFPEYKFSITRNGCSTVSICILSGPIDFGTDYEQVNHYHISNHYEGKVKSFLQLLADFVLKNNYVVVEDGDYGSIPKYYLDLSIGKWDKKYVIKK